MQKALSGGALELSRPAVFSKGSCENKKLSIKANTWQII